MVAILLASLASAPDPGLAAAQGPLRIAFIDVGQGDAVLLQLGDFDMLVDTGPRGQWQNLGRALASTVGALELVVITHPHDDHYGQLPEILQKRRVTRLITNGEPPPLHGSEPPSEWLRLERSLHAHGLVPEQLHVGDTLRPVSGLELRVLATGSPEGGEFPDRASGEAINNDSIVLVVSYAGRRLLLTGDIGQGAENLLISRYCPEGVQNCRGLRADILKVPHHGSADFTPWFFEAVHPRWAVVSADFENGKHCLPRIEPLEALIKRNVSVFSTSAERVEDVVVEIQPDGTVTWRPPSRDIFAWRKHHRQCFAEMLKQGTNP